MDHPPEIGDWKQISVLGSGAFGSVMLWKNELSNEFFAIKKCKFQKASALSPKQRERWMNEVDIMKSIDHLNVIKYKPLPSKLELIINKKNPTELPLLSMEYCRKGNLRRYLTNEPIKLCGLEEQDVRFILRDISSGLSYLHSKNITHRDIKPENIVLQHCDNRKGQTVYKIIDLGYAKELLDSTLSFVGTLHYLAPEIFYNQDYNCSVDYWSMGMMVFEVICGVLPFLPEMLPFDRYEKIRNKGPEDICIYMSYSGAISSSTELKREHFISSSLKRDMETWLKVVLQFDPANRVFAKSLSAFEYLHFILDKTIVQVFSVFKLEFYSYEISDGTLLGTLKAWISRDIKVPKNKLILLYEKGEEVFRCDDDELLVANLLAVDNNIVIFAFKMDAMVSENSTVSPPNLIKELFNNSNFQLKFAKSLYRQALFYVHTENRAMITFKRSYFCYLKYIETLYVKVRINYNAVCEKLTTLLSNIRDFFSKRKNNNLCCDRADLDANKELAECLKYVERLLSNVERREKNLKDFAKELSVLEKLILEIEDLKMKIDKIFNDCDIYEQFNKLNSKAFLEKKHNETNEVILKRIKNVLSDTIKYKFNLFTKNKDLKKYSHDFVNLFNYAEQFIEWIENFIVNVNDLLNSFIVVEERYQKILLNVAKNEKNEFSLSVNVEDSFYIVEQNKLLRCQFEDVLSKSVLAHKNYVQDASSLEI